jgi:3-isopropylmalate/(R)-2-methylmalate dehydratase small subunit
VDFGIRAVVSTAIADIFRSNSLKNGLVPVITDADTHQYLLDNPGITVVVDMEECTLSLPDGRSVEFPIDGFSRHCIMNGIDQLGFLQQQEAAIADFEADRPWKP